MDKIKQLILRLGIRSTYKGFLYLAYALTLCMQDESYLLSKLQPPLQVVV